MNYILFPPKAALFHEVENDCNYISDNIFLGNIFASHDKNLIGRRICNLICLTMTIDYQEPMGEYLHLPILDQRDANIIPLCEKAYLYIEKMNTQGKHVLVYCQAGKSRSAAIVIYYFMKKYKMNFETAHKYVIERRPCIELNSGFKAQLRLRWAEPRLD